jgi:hypothetical protein
LKEEEIDIHKENNQEVDLEDIVSIHPADIEYHMEDFIHVIIDNVLNVDYP